MDAEHGDPKRPRGELNEQEEYEVSLAAAAIAFKPASQRTPEEHAYLVALKECGEQIAKFAQEHNVKPIYGLATGSVLFSKDPDMLSADERTYYDAIANELFRDVNIDSAAGDLGVETQAAIARAAVQVFEKPAAERTEEEQAYVTALEEYARELRVATNTGDKAFVADYGLAAGTVVLVKPEAERTELEHAYMRCIQDEGTV